MMKIAHKKVPEFLIGGIFSAVSILLFSSSDSRAELLIEQSLSEPSKLRTVKECTLQKPALSKDDIFNPFVRPNIFHENYYGSGDVNDDGEVNWNDYDLIKNGTKNDYSDIDGDGVCSTNSDLALLEKHLNYGTVLPGDWNNLQTREQREDWFYKMLKIDDTNEIPYNENEWTARQYSSQIHFNFFGFDYKYRIPSKYNTDNYGRFNLPVRHVHIQNPNHAINTILVGEDPLNLDDWYFFEPQKDTNIDLHEWCEYNNTDTRISIDDVYFDVFSYDIDFTSWDIIIEFNVSKNDFEVIQYDNASNLFYNLRLRPNVLSKNYYGSGDVNNDSIVNWDDYELIKSGTQNDFSDIDGDGLASTNSDLLILEDHLNNGTTLPGDWDELHDKELKISWLNKMLKIDKTDEHAYIPDEWICNDFSIQIWLNYFGLRNKYTISSNYNINNNGIFNLPIYSVYIIQLDNISRSVSLSHNCVLVGGNPLNLHDWCFFDPQNDTMVNLHQRSEYYGTDIEVRVIQAHRFMGDALAGYGVVTFVVTKNDFIVRDYRENLVLTRPEPVYVAEDKKPIVFSLKQNYPNPFNGSTTIEYTITQPSDVVLEIYNPIGQLLETVADNYQLSGTYSVNWNANNYSTGIYIAALKTGNSVESKKMILVK